MAINPDINRAIITEGDKLTIITQQDIIICSVVSIRSRVKSPTPGNCAKAVKVEAPCSPEAIAELSVQMREMMKRNA